MSKLTQTQGVPQSAARATAHQPIRWDEYTYLAALAEVLFGWLG